MWLLEIVIFHAGLTFYFSWRLLAWKIPRHVTKRPVKQPLEAGCRQCMVPVDSWDPSGQKGPSPLLLRDGMSQNQHFPRSLSQDINSKTKQTLRPIKYRPGYVQHCAISSRCVLNIF